MKLLVVEPSPLPILIPLGSKYSIGTLFSNTLSLRSSLNVRDHVSQPYIAQLAIYKSTILSAVLYGCKTLREECRIRVFENRVQRRIYGPKRDDIGKWRRFHNKEIYILYSSPNIITVADLKGGQDRR